jgi:CubicO group peptidase (beta-lactamase class C family)
VAIFTLVERGKLRLTDKVFGPGAVLGTGYGVPPYLSGIDKITVDHLLMHTSGGWPNDVLDPMFSQAGKNHRQLITWVIAYQKAANLPGKKFAYSNFGYCVLGRVIEKVTGESYQGFVRNQILARCGVNDMRIAGNTREQRAPGEVMYYGGSNYGFGNAYNLDVTRMDSHGGWIASASSLVRFLVALPSLLRPETRRQMLTPSPVQPTYARGWRVNSKGTHWHTGSLAGTTTLMVSTTHGLCWAVLANGRERGAGSYTGAIDRMMWDMVRKVPAWRA